MITLELNDAVITTAEIITNEKFSPPGTEITLEDLPDFCRVSLTVEPAIHIEVWLPLENWNGRFNGVGLMGYSGAINYNALAPPLRRGYAVASTDGGHKSTPLETQWAISNPEAIESLGHRAHHEMTVKAREIIGIYYRRDASYSYFTGCSAGGWQGLTEAQRYPGDYDGIVAGGPVFNLIRLHAASLWNALQVREINTEKFNLLHRAVITACDIDDGILDGMIEDPTTCKFNPADMACTDGDKESCLTRTEIGAFRNIINGLKDSRGTPIYPGWPISALGGMTLWKNEVFVNIMEGTFRDLTYQGDTDWSLDTMNFDADVARADAVLGPHFNATSPDLHRFKESGGKLILYHAWNDPMVSIFDTIDYYRRIARTASDRGRSSSGRIDDFSRLFLAPAMGHCVLLPGPGPYVHDALGAIERWVEFGEAPDKLIVSNPDTGVSRPLCPHPLVAKYRGNGSTADASNFDCVTTKQ